MCAERRPLIEMTVQPSRIFATVSDKPKAALGYIFLYFNHTVLQYYKSLA
jgi:hypothetical protein